MECWSTPPQWMCEVAGYLQELEHAIVYTDPDHPKHVQWVRCVGWPCKNWDVFSFQELCTDPCNIEPCIIMLQHEVMVVDEWQNNGPQGLLTVSLCIQNAINLCSLSITYACPYHNPTTTMGHSIHNINISTPCTHTTPYMLSAICPVQ